MATSGIGFALHTFGTLRPFAPHEGGSFPERALNAVNSLAYLQMSSSQLSSWIKGNRTYMTNEVNLRPCEIIRTGWNTRTPIILLGE